MTGGPGQPGGDPAAAMGSAPARADTDRLAPDRALPDVLQSDTPDAGDLRPDAALSRQPPPSPGPDLSLFAAPPMAEQERMVEAMLFASAAPMSVAALADRMPHGCDPAEALALLRRRYELRGVHVVRVGDAWAMRTAPDLGFLMQRETVEMRKLSRAAIETLAIIAYHQPCTRTEIEEIRGVAVSRGTVDQLLELEWIRFGRRRMTPGRPVTFVVTEAFLDHFGLATARDLPGLQELRAAGLLDMRHPVAGGQDGDSGDTRGTFLVGAGEDDLDEAEAAALRGQSELFED